LILNNDSKSNSEVFLNIENLDISFHFVGCGNVMRSVLKAYHNSISEFFCNGVYIMN